MPQLVGPVAGLRSRVVDTTTGLFSHAPYPLADTMVHRGDPGLFGPDSFTWPVIGDVAAFVGGIRALLVQSAHPEVMAGVADHSRFREDPLGRLSRTSAYVTATAFGAGPEVEEAITRVRRAHGPVGGESHRGLPYRADAPELAAWVHNVLTDSFLVAYQAYGPQALPVAGADRFVAEQTRLGVLLGAGPLPDTAAELTHWIVHHDALQQSPGTLDTVRFLRKPPLPRTVRAAYRVLFAAAAATVPPRIMNVLGLRPAPLAPLAGRRALAALRWALGASPSWHLALLRVGADVPPGLFRNRPPGRVDRRSDMRQGRPPR